LWTSTSSASTARTRTTASRDSAVQPRAVLWDLDGTLADSREHHWRAWREALASSAPRANVEVVVASLADLPADAFERLVPPE
jgi:beta-phosphoglucomutase